MPSMVDCAEHGRLRCLPGGRRARTNCQLGGGGDGGQSLARRREDIRGIVIESRAAILRRCWAASHWFAASAVSLID